MLAQLALVLASLGAQELGLSVGQSQLLISGVSSLASWASSLTGADLSRIVGKLEAAGEWAGAEVLKVLHALATKPPAEVFPEAFARSPAMDGASPATTEEREGSTEPAGDYKQETDPQG